MKLPKKLIFLTILSVASGATIGQNAVPPAKSTGRISVYQSSEEVHESLQEKPPLQFGKERSAALTINVDDNVKYQEMDGFGASLTDSSAWLLDRKLTPEQRKETLDQLFDPKSGIGLSILRQPMGASDFAVTEY